MKEHSYGCEYPEGCSCGASEFNALISHRARLNVQLATVLGLSEPWPLSDTLIKLCEAVHHLKTVHNCDSHNYEEWWIALEKGREYIKTIETVLKK